MVDREPEKYVFAAVPYSNGAPLSHFLERVDPRARVTCDPPAKLAAKLIRGTADVAMVPVVDYFASNELAMIDGLGICADGDVWSVLLRCRRPIEQVRTVGLDPASHTSNALVRILLADQLHHAAELKHPASGEAVDASVVIGDRALCEPAAPGGDYDLAGLWKEMTGLPFVFAVWAYRAGHPAADELSRIAHAAKDAGVAAVDELAAIHASRLGLPVERCRAYLGSAVRYDVGPRHAEAMRLFERLLRERGLLPAPAGEGGGPDE